VKTAGSECSSQVSPNLTQVAQKYEQSLFSGFLLMSKQKKKKRKKRNRSSSLTGKDGRQKSIRID